VRRDTIDVSAKAVRNANKAPTTRTLAQNVGATGTATLMTENGISFTRYYRPADDNVAGFRVALSGDMDRDASLVGQRITVLVRARASLAGLTPGTQSLRTSDATIAATMPVGTPLTTSFAWYRILSDPVTALPDIVKGRIALYWSVDIAEVMFAVGNYQGEYADGNLPTNGWRWLGTSGASQSAGYPYTLESMGVGQPLATTSTLNQWSLLSRPLGPLEARTLIVTSTALTQQGPVGTVGANEYQNLANIADSTGNSNRGSVLRTGPSEGRRYEVRNQLGDAAAGFVSAAVGTRTVGMHTICASWIPGLTSMTISVDGGTDWAGAVAVGPTPYAHDRIRIENAALNFTPPPAMEVTQRARIWAGDFNAETRRRMVAWCARQDGAPIPSGY
jgi:hypothetical protein